jgi:hypothetical protein
MSRSPYSTWPFLWHFVPQRSSCLQGRGLATVFPAPAPADFWGLPPIFLLILAQFSPLHMKYASLALLGGFDMVVGSAEAEDVVDA